MKNLLKHAIRSSIPVFILTLTGCVDSNTQCALIELKPANGKCYGSNDGGRSLTEI